MAKKIQINYLSDKTGEVVGTHKSDDDYTSENKQQWDEWLNDGSVEHPDAPQEWDQYEFVAYTPAE
ncbi:MAG TPA: hypothetical protein VGC66_22025 [Pyrinomonadaceae bacterium]